MFLFIYSEQADQLLHRGNHAPKPKTPMNVATNEDQLKEWHPGTLEEIKKTIA